MSLESNNLIKRFQEELEKKDDFKENIVRKLVTKAELKHHNNVILQYYAGLFYERIEDTENAQKKFSRCIGINPDFTEPYFKITDHLVDESRIASENKDNNKIDNINIRLERLLLPIFNKETLDPNTGQKTINFYNNIRICSIIGPIYIKSKKYQKLYQLYNPVFNYLVNYFNQMMQFGKSPEYLYLESWKNICLGMGALHINIHPDQAYEYYLAGLLNNPNIELTESQIKHLFLIQKTLVQSCCLASHYSLVPKPFPSIYIDAVYNNNRIKKLDLLVTGIGGSGTSALMKELSNKFNINDLDDKDSLKHIGKPLIMNSKKAIYIYGEPTRTIYSIYKKSSNPNKHYDKLNKFSGISYDHSHTKSKVDNYKKYVEDVEERIEELNFDECKDDDEKKVLRTKADLSGIYTQFRNWKRTKVNYPIFMLDFQQFNETKNELANFLGIDINDLDLELDLEHYQRHNKEKEKYESPVFRDFYQKIYNDMKQYNGQTIEVSKNDKIRLGYISADFNENAVGFFLTPLLKHHNKDKFEVYCYSTRDLYDDYVKTFMKYVKGRFHFISGVNDISVFNLIKTHNIDILVDLSGHGNGNRMDLLSMKPAPIIINYLGFPGFTYLNEVDYRIVDEITDPISEKDEDNEHEKLIRINRPFICYQLPEHEHMPIIDYSTISDKIYIGIFNKSSKQHPLVRGFWKKIVDKYPNCILCIKMDCKTYNNEAYKILYNDFPQEQVIFYEYTETLGDYFELFNQLDFCVDTFPYSGTTTTCSSLLMGVPVFTVYDKNNRHVSNVTGSLLKYCNKVSEDPMNYKSKIYDNSMNYNKYICKNMKEYLVKICNEIEYLMKNKLENRKYISEENQRRNMRRGLFQKIMEPMEFMKEYEEKLENLMD